MNLPSYPLYRESGVKWLGEIPAHWEVRRLKFKAKARTSNVDKLTKEDEVPIRLCNYVDVYHNEEIQDGLSFMEATATAEEIERFGLKKGDVIITKDSESWDDIAVPAYVPEPMEGVVCGYHLSMVRAIENEFSGEYLFRLFCSDVLNDQFKVAANGVTRFGLPKAAIDNAIVVKPPLEEQQLIAGFLGRETARIDALIGKKRQILELLEEKRLAVITQAVTKGFDPAVPMKDSGIEWLGEVPAHWGVTILQRSITKIEQGWSPFCEERQATADEWAVLKSGCVNGGLFRENDHKALPATLEPRTDLEVQAGDILMCRASGSPDLIGSVAKVESCRPKVLFSDKTYRIHFDDRTEWR